MENKKVESYRDLIVWQMGHQLVLDVYKLSGKFPRKEQDYLVRQLREAAAQIPVNIALGFKKRGKTTKVHYYRTALNFVEQLSYIFILSKDLGYTKNPEQILETIDNIEKKLKGLLRSAASTK